jgi:hypothetical protein
MAHNLVGRERAGDEAIATVLPVNPFYQLFEITDLLVQLLYEQQLYQVSPMNHADYPDLLARPVQQIFSRSTFQDPLYWQALSLDLLS